MGDSFQLYTVPSPLPVEDGACCHSTSDVVDRAQSVEPGARCLSGHASHRRCGRSASTWEDSMNLLYILELGQLFVADMTPFALIILRNSESSDNRQTLSQHPLLLFIKPDMKNCPVLFAAVLARVVAGQSAVTVTAPAPSAPSPAEPPFSVTIVSAAQPDTSVSVSSLTVFASPNPAPSPPTQPSIDVTTVTASPSSAASPSSDRGGSGGGSSGGGSGGGSSPGVGICGLGYTYCGYILKNHQGNQ